MFRAFVRENGGLDFVEVSAYLAYVRQLSGQTVEVIVRKDRANRSLDQNSWFHAVPVALLSEYWGYDVEETKLLILGACFGWHDHANQPRLPIKPSSSSLTVEEFSRLTDWLPTWALQQFGVVIPLPNEVDAW